MKSKIPHFSLFLPDIRSGFNVGSFFRTCDGLGVDHIYLSGLTPYPPHKEIAKTALGAEDMVSWSYHLEWKDIIEELQNAGVHIVSLEVSEGAIPIQEFSPKKPLCLVVGNEVDGISDDMLRIADEKVFIPMRGEKESFNVSIAGSIALWEISGKNLDK